MNAATTDLARTAMTPVQMLQSAAATGATPEQIQHMMDLHERWEAGNARKAFVAAMAAFKANPPTIVKDRRVGYTNRDGTFTGYTHATLAEVATKIAAGLAAVGISHRWDVRHEAGMIVVSCILTHEGGHSESVTMPPVAPDDSGKKNSIQQVASAITYQQRYSLLAITGLAARDQDDDARGTEQAPDTLSEKQVADLECLLQETGADIAAFKRWCKVDSLGQILAKNYEHICKEVRERAKTRGPQ